MTSEPVDYQFEILEMLYEIRIHNHQSLNQTIHLRLNLLRTTSIFPQLLPMPLDEQLFSDRLLYLIQKLVNIFNVIQSSRIMLGFNHMRFEHSCLTSSQVESNNVEFNYMGFEGISFNNWTILSVVSIGLKLKFTCSSCSLRHIYIFGKW